MNFGHVAVAVKFQASPQSQERASGKPLARLRRLGGLVAWPPSSPLLEVIPDEPVRPDTIEAVQLAAALPQDLGWRPLLGRRSFRQLSWVHVEIDLDAATQVVEVPALGTDKSRVPQVVPGSRPGTRVPVHVLSYHACHTLFGQGVRNSVFEEVVRRIDDEAREACNKNEDGQYDGPDGSTPSAGLARARGIERCGGHWPAHLTFRPKAAGYKVSPLPQPISNGMTLGF
jgi:hypothetical protein